MPAIADGGGPTCVAPAAACPPRAETLSRTLSRTLSNPAPAGEGGRPDSRCSSGGNRPCCGYRVRPFDGCSGHGERGSPPTGQVAAASRRRLRWADSPSRRHVVSSRRPTRPGIRPRHFNVECSMFPNPSGRTLPRLPSRCHPSGMGGVGRGFRWYRCAQPPATFCHASGVGGGGRTRAGRSIKPKAKRR